MSFLAGNKTYVVAGGLAAASFALAMGWISRDTFEAIAGLLGAGGMATLRNGVKQVETKVDTVDTSVAQVEAKVERVDTKVAQVARP